LPDWVVERGIGETRFARIENGEIVEARILLDGIVPAGSELTGRLERSGLQLFMTVDGQQYFLPNGAHGVSDGGRLRAEVVRERIPGVEPWKRPLARLVHGELGPALPAARELPLNVRNELDDASWDDLIEDAGSGVFRFVDGELRISPTPAMTLIDVDGAQDLFTLAVSAARAAARAILRLQIGGSIGIDCPTLAGKDQRSFVAREIARALPRPFEHTALNGFGFMQIVRPRRHASLLELAQERAPFHARALLRRVGKERAGASRLVAHPAVVAVLERQADWIEALGRQIGGSVILRSEPSLPIHAGYAENS
jgi:hypothetical protein